MNKLNHEMVLKGERAFHAGIKRAPALDTSIGDWSRLNVSLLESWLHGWDKANLADSRDPDLVPASGGAEKPMVVSGRRLLYCWDRNQTNQFPGDHCYVDLDTDLPITDEEYAALCGR